MDATTTQIHDYFDNNTTEWDRLRNDIPGRVSHEIHRRFLDEHLTPGMRVLEIGAGPGTFTHHLAQAGAKIVVTDLSRRQLAENQRRITEASLAHNITAWRTADIRDLSHFPTSAYDLTLAYGGPLSYVFEDAPVAMAELLRVTRPGGTVVASVMSTLGAHRYYMRAVIEETLGHGTDITDKIWRTGDLRPIQPTGHVCQMYRADQILDLVAHAGAETTAISASNWASLADPDALARLEAHPHHWARFLDNEAWACRQLGALDGGTHILFAARQATKSTKTVNALP